MNWKLVIAVAFGLLIGILIAPFGHGTVVASTLPSSSHFQIEGVTDEQSSIEGGAITRTTYHAVFLLDTESGHVWRYGLLVGGHNGNGSTMGFARVPVE